LIINILIFSGIESFNTGCADFQVSPGAIRSLFHLIRLKSVICAERFPQRTRNRMNNEFRKDELLFIEFKFDEFPAKELIMFQPG